MSQTYDSYIEAEKNDQVKYRDCIGRVESMRRGEADKDGFNRNEFDLKRITVSGRDTVYVQLEPNDNASQNVHVHLSLHQARWLSTALLAGIAQVERYQTRKSAENDRARQRR